MKKNILICATILVFLMIVGLSFFTGFAQYMIVVLFGKYELKEISFCKNGVKNLVFDADENRDLKLHYSFRVDENKGRHSKLLNPKHAFLCAMTNPKYDCGLLNPIPLKGKWKLTNSGYISAPDWVVRTFSSPKSEEELFYGFTNNEVQVYGNYLYSELFYKKDQRGPSLSFKKELEKFRKIHCKSTLEEN